MQLAIIDAFTRTPGAGNRAGVVLDASGLSALQMQAAAAAVAASETAFVLQPPSARDAMGKPGRVELEVSGAPGRLDRARVGGVAITVMDGELLCIVRG